MKYSSIPAGEYWWCTALTDKNNRNYQFELLITWSAKLCALQNNGQCAQPLWLNNSKNDCLSWPYSVNKYTLTHSGRVTHICVSKLTIIGSDNGLSPDRHQAIIWTNDGILLIGPLGTNFSEILIEIHAFSFKKMHLKCRLENGGYFVSATMC